MRTAILGARVIDPASGLDQVTDLYIDGTKLAAFGQAPAGFVADKTLDAQGLIAAPGLVDLSVALREPGYSRKGSIATETLAAAAGGVTSLCCPPLTKPVLDTSAVAELILDRAREAGHTKVFPIGALSKGLAGEQLAELIALRDAGAAILVISEDLDELFQISDRIGALCSGRLSPLTETAQVSTVEVGRWMAGEFDQPAAAAAC